MNLRHILIGAIVLAALLLGGLWLFLRHEPVEVPLNAFQQSCMQGQRNGQLPLDAESEEQALAYCNCVAAQVSERLSAQVLADLGLGQAKPETGGKLDAAIAYCRDRAR
jgi:hypothetical protein